jgi:hypothetical protein
MSAHVRAARRERQAAALLGSRRVLRSRYESAPDLEPVRLPCGELLSVEVKTRKALPSLLRKALAQAAGYGPAGAVPCAVVSQTGGEPIIALPLRAFRRIAGLEPAAPAGPAADDESRVLEAIAARLRLGRRVYGPLDIEGDARDWRREALEEALDLAVYLAAALLRDETLPGAAHAHERDGVALSTRESGGHAIGEGGDAAE